MSSAPEKAIEGIDYFRLAAAAVRRLDPGPADLLRFERLRLQLATRGIRPGDARIPLWIAPALCRSAEDQARFLEAFPTHPNDEKEAIRTGAKSGGGLDDDDGGEGGRPRLNWREFANIAGGVALALILVAALAYFLMPDLEPVANGSTLPRPTPAVVLVPVKGQVSSSLDWWAMAWLLLPPFAALLYVIWQRRRRQAIRRDSAPQPHRSAPLAFAAGLSNLFDGARMRQALRKLRRHRAVSSPKLNVAATIRQTIAAGGMPVLRFGMRPRSPDYVVMSEREAPGDHLTVISRLLCARLAEEQVAHTQYEFFGDPRRLQKIVRGVPGAVVPLAASLARQNDARHLLFMEGYDCFAGENAPYWLDDIAETERPAMLDPRPDESWGRAEARIQSAGLAVFALNEFGLAGYGDYAGGTTGPPRPSIGEQDLPQALAADRDLLLGNDEPPEMLAAELVSDLDAWLDPGARYWLRALALFPYIDPALTIHLGSTLRDGTASLMEEQRFLRLARLPWLRAGRMPDWLRRELVHGLTPEQLGEAVAGIQAFLLPVETPNQGMSIDLARGNDKTLRKRLLEWLKLSPQSVLSEQILIDALKGLPPRQIGVEAPSALVRRTRALWANQEYRAALAALAAMVAITAWQWPMTDRSVASSVTAPSPPTPEVQDSNTTQTNTTEADQNVVADDSTAEQTGNTSGGNASAGARRLDPSWLRSAPTGAGLRAFGPFIVFFDWDKDEITPSAAAILDNAAVAYAAARRTFFEDPANSGRRTYIVLDGYSDTESGREYALQISGRRGQNVKAYLAGRGVPENEIVVVASGADMLVDVPDGVREPQNRRVEVTGQATPADPPQQQGPPQQQRRPGR